MRSLVLAFLVLFSASAFAQESRLKVVPPQPAPLLKLYLLDFEMRYEKSSVLDWEERKPLNLGVAFQRKQFDFLMEYAKYSVDSGNATLGIKREHQEVMAWGRWHFVDTHVSEAKWSLYAGLGVGGYEETVTTSTPGSSMSDKGGVQWMSGVSAGAEVQIPISQSLGFVSALEGRLLTAADFDPNPLGSGVVRLGLSWNL